ncbi:hypothetical protein PHMEG_00017511, partial [Phytophthora megakarya]
MKFRFCGGLEPPDWLLVELPLLSGDTSKVVRLLKGLDCDGKRPRNYAAVAALRFILTHASKYDTERGDLVEELQQLGMPQTAAEAVAQSYEDQRTHIQSQQRVQRFQLPGVEKIEWKVEAP